MALSQSGLASSFRALFDSMPASASDAADGLAQAYYEYASAAMFGASTVAIPSVNRDAMAAALLSAIAVPVSGSPATFAAAWASAVTAFWIGVPVAGAQAGATVGCPGAASLAAPLTAVFPNLGNTTDTGSQGMASALHVATLTVTAAVAPPPGTVLPVT